LSRDKGLSLKKHSLLLLESKIASLVWFDETLRGQLLEIKARIGSLNEGADENHYLLNLTFQSNISEENYRVVQENITRTCKMYATQARIVVDLIGKMK